MFTLIILVTFTFVVSVMAIIDICKTNFDKSNFNNLKDCNESSNKCSEVDYEICDHLKTI